MTYQVGNADDVRPLFESTGVLNNTVDTEFREIGERWPVFAFTHDLGIVGTSKATPIVYTIGYARAPIVQILNAPSPTSLRYPYYLTRYSDVPSMVRPLGTLYVTVLM